jgi:hypothetical protein
VKKEGNAPQPRSTKKTRLSAEEQLMYWTTNDPEEFPGLRVTEHASFNEVQPRTLEYVLAWSKQDAKREEAERARRLNILVNLEGVAI